MTGGKGLLLVSTFQREFWGSALHPVCDVFTSFSHGRWFVCITLEKNFISQWRTFSDSGSNYPKAVPTVASEGTASLVRSHRDSKRKNYFQVSRDLFWKCQRQVDTCRRRSRRCSQCQPHCSWVCLDPFQTDFGPLLENTIRMLGMLYYPKFYWLFVIQNKLLLTYYKIDIKGSDEIRRMLVLDIEVNIIEVNINLSYILWWYWDHSCLLWWCWGHSFILWWCWGHSYILWWCWSHSCIHIFCDDAEVLKKPGLLKFTMSSPTADELANLFI